MESKSLLTQSLLSANARKWLLENFALGVKNYWFTFIADSSSALFFLAWDLFAKHERPLFALAALALGYFLWGLTEYIVHRWVYHQPDGIFGDGHRMHHEDALALIAMPWFMTTISVFGLWYVVAEVLRVPRFSAGLAGWLAGYVWYSLVHHSHHHWDIRSVWMRKLKAYHRIHHQFPDRNYGVTTRFWDDVFRTRFQKSKGRQTAEEPAEWTGAHVTAEQPGAVHEAERMAATTEP